MLSFKPLYYENKLKIVNPNGFVGVVSLWSSPDLVFKRLGKVGVDLSPDSSPIAVIGNLRGNGLPHLLRNLLYNPQITNLVCCGRNRSESLEDFLTFFTDGTEAVDIDSPYRMNGEPIPAVRIKGRKRLLDSLVRLRDFTPRPEVVNLGWLVDEDRRNAAHNYFLEVLRCQNAAQKGFPPNLLRRDIPLPNIQTDEFPCNPRAFVVCRDGIVEAWEELIFVLYRFGKVVILRKGNRKELQNIKVVVNSPTNAIDSRLTDYWFSEDEIRQYQTDILSGTDPLDEPYTYGNRLRAYFGVDSLDKVVKKLKDDKEDRKCYISLWDSSFDLVSSDSPCLVSLFFRLFNGQLTLCANYRTHNSMDAWIYNFYGLKAILDHVAEQTAIPAGPITVISHSISIDMDESTMARAKLLVEKSRRPYLKNDPNGHFCIFIDRKTDSIVVNHCMEDGLVLREYRGKRAAPIQHKLHRDMAISDINHAMYIGRQLARAEIALKRGYRFVQS